MEFAPNIFFIASLSAYCSDINRSLINVNLFKLWRDSNCNKLPFGFWDFAASMKSKYWCIFSINFWWNLFEIYVNRSLNDVNLFKLWRNSNCLLFLGFCNFQLPWNRSVRLTLNAPLSFCSITAAISIAEIVLSLITFFKCVTLTLLDFIFYVLDFII